MRGVLLAFLAALALALGDHAAAADPVTAAATVDRDVINVGDAVTLSVIAQAAAGYQIVDPGVPRVFGDFEILETLPARQDPVRAGVTRITFRYRITSFRLGQLAIPPLVVAYTDPAGRHDAVTTGEVAILVRSVIGAGERITDIRPLAPQLSLPGGLMSRIASSASAAEVLLVAALVVLVAIRWLRRPRPVPAVERAPRPVQDALAELIRIAELRLPDQGRLREHYELLAASLRRYVRARFGLSATHRTPRELRIDLERAGADRAQIAVIYEVLHDAEIARYRHLAPYPSRAREAVRAVLEVMRKAAADEEYQTSAAQLP